MTAVISATPLPSAVRASPPFWRPGASARFVLATGVACGCFVWPGCGDNSTSPTTPASGATVSKPTVVLGRPTDSSIVAGENIFPSSGHLRVTVSATDVRVEYVRSVAPADETATRRNGAIVTGYVIR
jgi:hypothetical protein